MSMFTRTALAAALLAASPLALAATLPSPQTDTMTVSITIENSCTVTANDLNFGPTSSLAADIDAGTTVDVTCSGKGPISIAFSPDTHAGATFADRQMAGDTVPNTDTISYALYQGSAGGQLLGDGTTGGSTTIDATSTGGTDSYDVFGRVFSGQGVKTVDSYSDTVTATVSF